MKSRTYSWHVLFLLTTIAALTAGCGRLRPNGNDAPAAATFTPAAPGGAPTAVIEQSTTTAPTQANAPSATPLAEAATAPIEAPTTAPTEAAPTVAPAPTTAAGQDDSSGDALDDLLGGLLNGVSDDPTFQSELDQIP